MKVQMNMQPGQNGRHFADDVFKCILLKDNVWISVRISLKFVPKVPINNIDAIAYLCPNFKETKW